MPFFFLNLGSLREYALKNSNWWFEKWFIDVCLWERPDLAMQSFRWICVKNIPIPYWHDLLFGLLGAKLGRLLEVSPATLQMINMTKAWLKIDVQEGKIVSCDIIAKFLGGKCEFKI